MPEGPHLTYHKPLWRGGKPLYYDKLSDHRKRSHGVPLSHVPRQTSMNDIERSLLLDPSIRQYIDQFGDIDSQSEAIKLALLRGIDSRTSTSLAQLQQATSDALKQKRQEALPWYDATVPSAPLSQHVQPQPVLSGIVHVPKDQSHPKSQPTSLSTSKSVLLNNISNNNNSYSKSSIPTSCQPIGLSQSESTDSLPSNSRQFKSHRQRERRNKLERIAELTCDPNMKIKQNQIWAGRPIKGKPTAHLQPSKQWRQDDEPPLYPSDPACSVNRNDVDVYPFWWPGKDAWEASEKARSVLVSVTEKFLDSNQSENPTSNNEKNKLESSKSQGCLTAPPTNPGMNSSQPSIGPSVIGIPPTMPMSHPPDASPHIVYLPVMVMPQSQYMPSLPFLINPTLNNLYYPNTTTSTTNMNNDSAMQVKKENIARNTISSHMKREDAPSNINKVQVVPFSTRQHRIAATMMPPKTESQFLRRRCGDGGGVQSKIRDAVKADRIKYQTYLNNAKANNYYENEESKNDHIDSRFSRPVEIYVPVPGPPREREREMVAELPPSKSSSNVAAVTAPRNRVPSLLESSHFSPSGTVEPLTDGVPSASSLSSEDKMSSRVVDQVNAVLPAGGHVTSEPWRVVDVAERFLSGPIADAFVSSPHGSSVASSLHPFFINSSNNSGHESEGQGVVSSLASYPLSSSANSDGDDSSIVSSSSLNLKAYGITQSLLQPGPQFNPYPLHANLSYPRSNQISEHVTFDRNSYKPIDKRSIPRDAVVEAFPSTNLTGGSLSEDDRDTRTDSDETDDDMEKQKIKNHISNSNQQQQPRGKGAVLAPSSGEVGKTFMSSQSPVLPSSSNPSQPSSIQPIPSIIRAVHEVEQSFDLDGFRSNVARMVGSDASSSTMASLSSLPRRFPSASTRGDDRWSYQLDPTPSPSASSASPSVVYHSSLPSQPSQQSSSMHSDDEDDDDRDDRRRASGAISIGGGDSIRSDVDREHIWFPVRGELTETLRRA